MVDAARKHSVLREIDNAFGGVAKPEQITVLRSPDDQERKQIESQFSGLHRDDLTDYDVAMMLVDSPLLAPNAFWHFLPRLAKAALFESADVFMLWQRLENAEKAELSTDQAKAVVMLQGVLDAMESECE